MFFQSEVLKSAQFQNRRPQSYGIKKQGAKGSFSRLKGILFFFTKMRYDNEVIKVSRFFTQGDNKT